MIGRLIENTNPSIQVITDNKFNELESGTIVGMKDNNVGVYYKIINAPEENITPTMEFPTGPSGILHQDVEYLLLRNGDRNFYTNSDVPARIYDTYHPVKLHIDINSFQDDFETLASGIHHETYKPYMSKYMQTAVPLQFNSNLSTFKSTSNFTASDFKKYFPDMSEIHVKDTKFDRQLLKALRNPERHIEYLQEKLKLDKSSGYYCYNDVPYICLHEFMKYEGKSMKSIVNACNAGDYCCKYCGAELIYTADENEVNLSDTQFKLIYRFLECLKLDDNYEDVFSKLLITSINQALEQLELDNSQESVSKAEGFTAIYLLKLAIELKKAGVKVNKESEFKQMTNKVFQRCGWNDSTVSEVMKNNDRFKLLDHVTEVISSFKAMIESKDEDKNSIVHILLDGMNEKGNPIQELYLKDKTKLGELVQIMTLNANNYSQIPNYDNIVEKLDLPFKKDAVELYMKSGLSVKSFYNLWWKKICPLNKKGLSHNFDKNGKCKLCGITEKNVNDICEKYNKEILEILTPDIGKTLKLSDKKRIEIIEKIKKMKSEIPSRLNKSLFEKNMLSKTRKCLEEFIGVGELIEFETTQENLCKMANFVISEKESNDRLISEMNALLIPEIEGIGRLIHVLKISDKKEKRAKRKQRNESKNMEHMDESELSNVNIDEKENAELKEWENKKLEGWRKTTGFK